MGNLASTKPNKNKKILDCVPFFPTFWFRIAARIKETLMTFLYCNFLGKKTVTFYFSAIAEVKGSI